MRIEDLTLVLRPRGGFQAADLGMGLVRANARVIWLAWLALVLPVALALNLAGWYLDMLWLAGLLLWWLKPVFERIPLYVISRAAFGEQVSVGRPCAPRPASAWADCRPICCGGGWAWRAA